MSKREQRLCRASLDFEERRRELEEERRDFQIDLLTTRVQEQAEELARPTPLVSALGGSPNGMGHLDERHPGCWGASLRSSV